MYFLHLFDCKIREKVIRSKLFKLNNVKIRNVHAHNDSVT